MDLFGILERIWRQQNSQMAWGRIPAGQVIGRRRPSPFKEHDDYVDVRLASMFLRDSRRLWLKLSPLAHATVTLNGLTTARDVSSVIGPAQFGELATAPADRNVILNQRLAGPSVWRGGDLNLAAGLFAVPKDRAATALLDTLGQLAQLGVPGLGQAEEIARIVKGGVEGLIGLDGTQPRLGVRSVLKDPRTSPTPEEQAEPCILAGIAAPQSAIDFGKLWVNGARLYQGSDHDALSPFEQHDHLLIGVELGPPREDWRGLPSLLPHETAMNEILSNRDLAIADRKSQLSAAFNVFGVDLDKEEELSNPDKSRIRGEVRADLRRKIAMMEDPLFAQTEERRSAAVAGRPVDPATFDFLDVGADGLEGAAPMASGSPLF